jgi:hypothetical protein
MDDEEKCDKPERFIRPESDLSEGNAFTDATEDLPPLERRRLGHSRRLPGDPFGLGTGVLP